MRFLDYNGSGGLDSQDIATSIAVESARDDEEDDAAARKALESNAGCATMAAFMALTILIITQAL
ncbi:MAG: hypothetical protein IJH04_05780 [Eggerthellaceae bacterium]|nr:hypothetical protein [Eggerthellaceae bacterium]